MWVTGVQTCALPISFDPQPCNSKNTGPLPLAGRLATACSILIALTPLLCVRVLRSPPASERPTNHVSMSCSVTHGSRTGAGSHTIAHTPPTPFHHLIPPKFHLKVVTWDFRRMRGHAAARTSAHSPAGKSANGTTRGMEAAGLHGVPYNSTSNPAPQHRHPPTTREYQCNNRS